MTLSNKEKEYIKLIKDITQIEYKTIERVFKGMFLVQLLYFYKKEYGSHIESKLDTFPITIPYLMSFDAKANMESVYKSDLNPALLSNITFSEEMRTLLLNMMKQDHNKIRDMLMDEVGSEFKNILGLSISDDKISED